MEKRVIHKCGGENCPVEFYEGDVMPNRCPMCGRAVFFGPNVSQDKLREFLRLCDHRSHCHSQQQKAIYALQETTDLNKAKEDCNATINSFTREERQAINAFFQKFGGGF